MAVCVHLLLLLVPVLSLCEATQYYVTPTEPTNTSCPAQPCHTLNHYTNHSDHYFKSNTVFTFLPGTHLMNRPLEIRDVENISLEASDDNNDNVTYPQLVAQFTCQYETDSDCIVIQTSRIYAWVCCSVVWMINVTHAAIEGISVTVTTPNVFGVILQQCSHLHIQSNTYIGIQEQDNVISIGIMAYESSDIETDSIEVSNFTYGVMLYMSRSTSMMNVSAAHNEVNGIRLETSTDTSMMNVSAAHNGWEGIVLYDSTDTSMMNVSAAHNGVGIWLDHCTDTSMMNVSAAHNGQEGIVLFDSTDTSMMNVSAAHNGVGIWLDHCTDTSMMNVSAAHNGQEGIVLFDSTDTSMMNVSAAHNGDDGIFLDNCNDTSMMNVSAAHNQNNAITMIDCTNTSLYYSYIYITMKTGYTSLNAEQHIFCTTSLKIQCA